MPYETWPTVSLPEPRARSDHSQRAVTWWKRGGEHRGKICQHHGNILELTLVLPQQPNQSFCQFSIKKRGGGHDSTTLAFSPNMLCNPTCTAGWKCSSCVLHRESPATASPGVWRQGKERGVFGEEKQTHYCQCTKQPGLADSSKNMRFPCFSCSLIKVRNSCSSQQ